MRGHRSVFAFAIQNLPIPLWNSFAIDGQFCKKKTLLTLGKSIALKILHLVDGLDAILILDSMPLSLIPPSKKIPDALFQLLTCAEMQCWILFRDSDVDLTEERLSQI